MNIELSSAKVKVLPVLIDNAPLPGFLLGKVFADMRQEENYPEQFEKLIVALGVDPDFAIVPNRALGKAHNRIGEAILNMAQTKDNAALASSIRALKEQIDATNKLITYAVDSNDGELYSQYTQDLEVMRGQLTRLERLSVSDASERLAFQSFHRSARFGDPEGMWNLGWRYWLGQGTDENHTKAIAWWTQASRHGHVAASEKLLDLKRRFEADTQLLRNLRSKDA
jgi:hypothetical protein